MKKLFSVALLGAISISCATCIAGCGSIAAKQTEADLAQNAARILKVMYLDKLNGTQSEDDYEVLGQVKLKDGKAYDVDWAVSSAAFAALENYVKVGDMDESTKLVTVSVTQAEEAIGYTLTASVTIGKETETVSFERTVPAKPKQQAMHAGTREDPFTPTNVIEIANALEGTAKDNYFFDVDGETPKQVYVTGYIVDCGTDQVPNGYSRVGFVWIADEYSEGKNKNSSDAVMVLSINYDGEKLTGYSDLKKGAKITVKGYIEKYIKNSSTAPQPEVTYYKGNGITCEELEK